MRRYGDYGRPLFGTPKVIFLTALIIIVIVGGLYGYSRHKTAEATITAEELDRVLLIAAAPNENGEVVAQIIVVADVSDATATLKSISPSLTVNVPGTSYDTIQYAYPFGGAEGVSSAFARATDDDELPYVLTKSAELICLLDAAGGAEITIPAAMNVFDGESLYSFSKDKYTITGSNVSALFRGAPYLGKTDRAILDEELAELLAFTFAAAPNGLMSEADEGSIITNLDVSALEKLEDSLSN